MIRAGYRDVARPWRERMRWLRALCLAVLAVLAACGGGADPGDDCNAKSLPLSGLPDAPTVVAVSLEVQQSGIVLLATATDPQGTGNLLGVNQSIALFPGVRCTGTPIVLQDDLAGSGVEESFGTVVDAATNAALYNAIASTASWPVEVDFRDQDGHRISGRVFATVID